MSLGRLDYVASAYVIDSAHRVLLVNHPTLRLWLPPGGHLETNETPQEGAIREVFEETGVRIEIVSTELESEMGAHGGEPIVLLDLPVTVQLERIDDSHYHVNFIFAARPLEPLVAPDDRAGVAWFPVAALTKHGISQNVAANSVRAHRLVRGQV